MLVLTLLSAAQARGRSNLDELREERQASERYQDLGEALYRELLPWGGAGGSGGGRTVDSSGEGW